MQVPTPEQLARSILDSAWCSVPEPARGMGLPVTEAMAVGCGVVSTRNGGVESYAVDRENALLLDVDDVEGLTAAVLELLDDTEAQVASGRRRLRDRRPVQLGGLGRRVRIRTGRPRSEVERLMDLSARVPTVFNDPRSSSSLSTRFRNGRWQAFTDEFPTTPS